MEQQTGFGRVFLQETGADPGNPYSYQGCGKMGGFTESLGGVTALRCPSSSQYDEFDVTGSVKGEKALPTTSFIARLQPRMRMLRIKCPFDLQAHYGECTDPSSFHQWNQVVAFEQARFTQRSSSDLTALDEAERAAVVVTGEITAERIWYIDPMTLTEVAQTEVTDEVVGVAMDPRVMCGACGVPSDGTQRMFAVVVTPMATSPGLPAELLASEDGGATWTEYVINSLAFNEDPSGMAIVGNYMVVVSNDSGSLHYASLDDLSTWTEVTTGFDVLGPPNAIFALNSTAVWIVGDAGYIYFTEDITTGVTVQSTGAPASNQDLYDVHAHDANTVVACGANATAVVTVNGGTTWAAVGVTGLPVVGSFRACWARTETCWMLGGTQGVLYFTKNTGVTWSAGGFPGSGAGTIYDIVFCLHSASPFGFMAHTPAAGRGRILRTLDGGNSWHQLPESAGAIPDNDRIVCLAACGDPNIVLAGGLGANGVDGILLVGS